MSGPGNSAGAPAPSAPTSAPSPSSGGKPQGSTGSPGLTTNLKGISSQPGSPSNPQKSGKAPTAATPAVGQEHAAPQRQPHLIKHAMPDGSEMELDIAEHLESYLKGYKKKLKVNGVEKEVALSEMEERFPLADHSYTKLREAADMRKQAEVTVDRLKQIDSRIKKDPASAQQVLEKWMGSEAFLEMAAQAVEKRIAYERLSPEERQFQDRMTQQERLLFEKQKQAKALDRQIAEHNEARIKIEAAAVEKQYVQQFSSLLKQAGAPVTPQTISLLAQKKQEAKKFGVPHTNADLARDVANEMRELAAHYQQSLDPEALREQLGSNAEKLRQADLSRVSGQPGRKIQTPAQKTATNVPNTIKTPEQFRRFLRDQDRKAGR